MKLHEILVAILAMIGAATIGYIIAYGLLYIFGEEPDIIPITKYHETYCEINNEQIRHIF